MAIDKPVIGQNNWGDDLNSALDAIDDRLIALEGAVDEIVPLPSFLTYVEGRAHLPTLNSNFGWDSSGVWFSEAQEGASYPIFTNFTIPQNYKVQVEFDVEIDSYCSDAGLCVYVNGTVPQWSYGTNNTRIAAQFNCPAMEIQGAESTSSEEAGIPDPGTYRMVFIYDRLAVNNNVIFQTYTTGESPELVSQATLSEVLPTGAYRVGFAADMTDSSPNPRTYISNLSISINNGATLYEDTLQEGNSGTPATDLTVPVDIKDDNGNALITFQKSYTGTARIWAPQDDLALRSARDILLYPGDDGPGKVFIGWGDANMTPDSGNEVATKGYVDEAITPPLTPSPNMEGAILASNIADITLQLSDANKFFYVYSDENLWWQQFNVPTDSQVNFPVGTVITFATVDATVIMREVYDETTDTRSNVYGQGQGTSTDYMYFSGTGVGHLTKLASNQWIFTGPNVYQD